MSRMACAFFRKPTLVSSSVRRGMSSGSSSLSRHFLRVDPSKLVSGLDMATIENSPEIIDYLEANFPEAFSAADRDAANNEASPSLSATELPKPNINQRLEESYSRNIRPLSCYIRDKEGSRSSRYLRRNFIVPGILYGSDPSLGIFSHQPESKLLLQTEARDLQRELDRYHHNIESRVYDLTVYDHPEATEGHVHRVIAKNLQRHPVHGSLLYCLNYVRYHAARPIKLPIAYINEEESLALKRDGFIVPIQRYIECFVEDGVDIPEKLELECTALKLKEVIRTDRIILPDGVRFSDRLAKQGKEFIIGVVFGRRRDGEGADEEAA
jgi:ribosomal protein L25 (general stress protein Ctc)